MKDKAIFFPFAYNFKKRFRCNTAFFLLFASSLMWSQILQTTTYKAGSGVFTVPSCVTQITVEVWGGGGGGGIRANTNNAAGPGGGGGGYARVVLNVTPGEEYSYIIGDGGVGTTDYTADGTKLPPVLKNWKDVKNGKSSTFSRGSNSIIAYGGDGALDNTTNNSDRYNVGNPAVSRLFGQGGTASSNFTTVSSVFYAGGAGGDSVTSGSTRTSGGGGGAGNLSGLGGNGTTSGGSSNAPGGKGADGVTNNKSGIAAGSVNLYGGGGSGGSKANSTIQNGGAGAPGAIIISYYIGKTFQSASGSWATPASWLPGVVPNQNDCVIIPQNKTVAINTPDAAAKTLTLEINGKLTINKDQSLTVTDAITNNDLGNGDNFVIESDGNLLQTNAVVNTGNVKARREVLGVKNSLIHPLHMDYIYWSSPVSGQGLAAFSPKTPTNRIYQYNETDDYFNGVNLTTEPNFVVAKGYAFRAEDGLAYNYDKTYDFRGQPNNGPKTIVIQRSPDNGSIQHGYNMIGNPYPSNINFDDLYAANSASIFKTAWFWVNDNFTVTQSGNGYEGNGYAVYNGTGGTNGTTDSNEEKKEVPNGIVKVSQGFIVQMKNAAAAGNVPNKATLTFNNGMRVSTAGQFYSKGIQPKDRFWLKLVSPTNVANTLLLGYIPGATDGYEQDFDAEAFGLSSDLFYSNLEDKRLVIQGKGNFSNDDKVAIGANFFSTGTYTISLMTPEGIFENEQTIYLRDKETGAITNLSEGNYSFQSNKGETNGRFEIVYQPEIVLVTDSKSKEGIVVYRDSDNFIVQAQNKKITALEVFDASGRLVYSLNPNALQAVIPGGKFLKGIYVLKINQSGLITTKKIMK